MKNKGRFFISKTTNYNPQTKKNSQYIIPSYLNTYFIIYYVFDLNSLRIFLNFLREKQKTEQFEKLSFYIISNTFSSK